MDKCHSFLYFTYLLLMIKILSNKCCVFPNKTIQKIKSKLNTDLTCNGIEMFFCFFFLTNFCYFITFLILTPIKMTFLAHSCSIFLMIESYDRIYVLFLGG